MRHRNSLNHLGRTSSHRNSMLSNMANSLFLHKRITTTLAKAKALRSVVEPILTRSKSDTTHNRREVFRLLQSKVVVSELFRDISLKIGNRPGGYTRILKTGNRIGDNAELCIIELVDYNENMLSSGKKETTKKRRSRKVKKTTETAPASSADKTPSVVKAETESTTTDDSKEESPVNE
jgi:large subunit ribosomal protein L17